MCQEAASEVVRRRNTSSDYISQVLQQTSFVIWGLYLGNVVFTVTRRIDYCFFLRVLYCTHVPIYCWLICQETVTDVVSAFPFCLTVVI